MSQVGSGPDSAVLQPLHDAGRYREVMERFLALDGALGRGGDPQALYLAASAAARLGQLEHAATWSERALEGFLERQDERGALRATNLMGAVDFECGRMDRAELRFGNARRLARRTGDLLMIARTTNNLANIAHLRGRMEQALRLYRTALTAFEAAGDCRGAAETLHNLALRFHQLGALRDASHAADQAVLRAERCERPALLALCLAGAAEIAIERQEYVAAQEKLDWSEALARTGDDVLLVLEIRRLRMLLALETGHVERAERGSAEVAREALELGSALVAAEATAVRSLALKALKRPEDAASQRASALEAFQRLGATDLMERFELDWEERGWAETSPT